MASEHGASVGVWTATFVIIAGTIVGGIGLIYWNWPMFYTGVGLFVAACLGAWRVGIMETVTEFGPGPDRPSEPAA
jgi:hypothetical protein